MKDQSISCLFLDIGGVLLTNGWDRFGRKRAADHFGLEVEEFQERHHLTFDTYEEGKLTLKQYLDRVVFYEPRSFTHEQFQRFMYEQSLPYPEMIQMVKLLKEKYSLKVVVVSNEGPELNEHRIREFKLSRLVDAFISSCFVHIRKPDVDIFKLAIDIAQIPVHEILYIENTPMFVQIAESLGIKSILHKEYQTTLAALEEYGLQL